eukprot:CAMPEP_0182589100 /NCGR_PEP_ID=MMETSP1324-20130603/68796_1 /TAXON_ID=236786 /ORGANISM="Florenciella sp., Strain RCC1587" /LENGTH=108 /DNA_ID=CAMNT_0024806221 /DNA_START=18 /DNA_END=341 /DNA_ORIENTATION=+
MDEANASGESKAAEFGESAEDGEHGESGVNTAGRETAGMHGPAVDVFIRGQHSATPTIDPSESEGSCSSGSGSGSLSSLWTWGRTPKLEMITEMANNLSLKRRERMGE